MTAGQSRALIPEPKQQHPDSRTLDPANTPPYLAFVFLCSGELLHGSVQIVTRGGTALVPQSQLSHHDRSQPAARTVGDVAPLLSTAVEHALKGRQVDRVVAVGQGVERGAQLVRVRVELHQPVTALTFRNPLRLGF